MDLDGVGQGTHAILAGDYNIQRSSDSSYQFLLSPGPGQAFDPINHPGTWNDTDQFRSVHTQALSKGAMPGLFGGGMDDRFDFQLVTGEFLDGEGLHYIPGSYRAFGNNGTHALSGNISGGSGASPAVLSALMTASDHLPVVADYQLPAVLEVITAAIPAKLVVGQAFQLAVTVKNAADVLIPQGADELDYMLSATGNVAGAFADSALAMGDGNVHWLTLDTTAPGMKSGLLTAYSASQGVANSYVEIPIRFEVIGGLPGDFDRDGTVDAADYVVWRKGRSTTHTQDQFNVWRNNFGRTASEPVRQSAIPEPATHLLVVTVASLFLRPRCSRFTIPSASHAASLSKTLVIF